LPYFPMGLALKIMAVGIRVMVKRVLPIRKTYSGSNLKVCLLAPVCEEFISLVYREFLLAVSMPVLWLGFFFLIFLFVFILWHPRGRRFCALLIGGVTSLLYWTFFTGAGVRRLSVANAWELLQIAVVCFVCHVLYNVVAVFFLATDATTDGG